MIEKNVFEITEKKLEELLDSENSYNPDAVLLKDYSFWLGRALLKRGESDNFLSFCTRLMDKIYYAQVNKGYQWIDKVESLTYISLIAE